MITVAIPSYNSRDTLALCMSKVSSYPILNLDNTVRLDDVPKRLNIGRVRRLLAKECKTKYILYLDSDVIIDEPIETLLDNLKENVGMVGYSINKVSNHVQMGNALMLTENARKINWCRNPDICNCLNAKEQLAEAGMVTLLLSSISVRHLRR